MNNTILITGSSSGIGKTTKTFWTFRRYAGDRLAVKLVGKVLGLN